MDKTIRESIEAFLYFECRLLDERRFLEWEALWMDHDTIYWVPAADENADPTKKISYVYDNRHRMSTRIQQLVTGDHYAQVPESVTQHYLSNMEIESATDEGHDEQRIRVRAGLLVIEARLNQLVLWPATVWYLVCNRDNTVKLQEKKVVLVNRTQPIPSLGFIL